MEGGDPVGQMIRVHKGGQVAHTSAHGPPAVKVTVAPILEVQA